MMSIALLAVLGLAGAGQDTTVDDWTFVERPGQGQVAMTEFAGGQAIIAQCLNGELKVLVAGMPATTQLARQVEATRADGRRTYQSWLPSTSPGVFTAGSPGRDARFLRGGGRYEISSADGETPAVRASFELPAQSANLDRVISACNWPLEDERDRFEVPAPGAYEFASTGRSRRGPPPGTQGRVSSVTQVSCIIHNLRLQDCRVDHQLPAQGSFGERAARQSNGERLTAADPAAVEGRIVYMTTTTETFVRND